MARATNSQRFDVDHHDDDGSANDNRPNAAPGIGRIFLRMRQVIGNQMCTVGVITRWADGRIIVRTEDNYDADADFYCELIAGQGPISQMRFDAA